MCPEQLYNSMPVVGEISYAYEILLTPEFEMDEHNAHLITLFKTRSNYALVLRRPLPLLAEMPLFMTQGMIRVQIASKPVEIRITTANQLNQLKSHHIMIFRDLLQIWKSFFVVDQRNEQNSFLLAPFQNGNIDWKVVNDFQRLSPIRKYSKAERAEMHFKPEDWIGKIVNTWYSFNESERYVVTRVLENERPSSSFQDKKFESYADFVRQKYSEEIVQPNQFLIEVKSLTTRRNFFINAKGKTDKKLTSRQRLRIVLIPEMCHNFLYPGDLWLKALFLPCILHRLNFMLHAETIRVRINTYLGIKDTAYQPKPLMIDTSLKRVIDGDGNAMDTNEVSNYILIIYRFRFVFFFFAGLSDLLIL